MTTGAAAPAPRSLTAFVEHLDKRTFMLCGCDDCGNCSVPNAEQCETCGSVALRWRAAIGTARLVSWAYDSVSGTDEPHLTPVVIAQFSEGPWWWGRLKLDAPAALEVGLLLRVDAIADPEVGTLPFFRLAT